MTDYNDGLWHGWNGGECPVHSKSIVRAVFCDNAQKSGADLLGQWIEREAGQFQPICWQNKIEAFRVVKEHREPRELWHILDRDGGVYDTFTDREVAERCAERWTGFTLVHYREVMDDDLHRHNDAAMLQSARNMIPEE